MTTEGRVIKRETITIASAERMYNDDGDFDAWKLGVETSMSRYPMPMFLRESAIGDDLNTLGELRKGMVVPVVLERGKLRNGKTGQYPNEYFWNIIHWDDEPSPTQGTKDDAPYVDHASYNPDGSRMGEATKGQLDAIHAMQADLSNWAGPFDSSNWASNNKRTRWRDAQTFARDEYFGFEFMGKSIDEWVMNRATEIYLKYANGPQFTDVGTDDIDRVEAAIAHIDAVQPSEGFVGPFDDPNQFKSALHAYVGEELNAEKVLELTGKGNIEAVVASMNDVDMWKYITIVVAAGLELGEEVPW